MSREIEGTNLIKKRLHRVVVGGNEGLVIDVRENCHDHLYHIALEFQIPRRKSEHAWINYL